MLAKENASRSEGLDPGTPHSHEHLKPELDLVDLFLIRILLIPSMPLPHQSDLRRVLLEIQSLLAYGEPAVLHQLLQIPLLRRAGDDSSRLLQLEPPDNAMFPSKFAELPIAALVCSTDCSPLFSHPVGCALNALNGHDYFSGGLLRRAASM
jgi:hypothetical protein